MNIIWKPAASGNYKVGRSRGVDTIVFHHIVGDAGAAISRFQTSGVQVSSTYVIGSDGQVYQMVKESDTPYTNGNFDWNSRSITIEHAGGHSSVPYTEAMYRSSIELCRAIRSRYNITQFKRHREIVSTACPGGLDVERIVNESSKGDEVIDDGDVPQLRIAHSEAGGWDLLKTHRGEYDGVFLGAWKGKPWQDMVYTQWQNGAGWRDYRQKAIAFYEQYKDKINQMAVEDDEPQVQEALNKLKEAETKAKEAQAKLQEAIND